VKNITINSITDAAVASFDRSEDLRFKEIIGSLIGHLHAFAKDVKLSREEWQAGLEFLFAAGQISNAKRNEFVLTSDVLGLSSLVDLINSFPGATDGSVLGPFHSHDSRMLSNGSNLIDTNEGEPLIIRGRVTDVTGHPIPGATLDFWQTAANGLYPMQDPKQDPQNLRGKIQTDEAGKYAIASIKPSSYTVPYDGPVGGMLRAGGRHAWRPAHLHFIVSALGFSTITTEIFDVSDPYIEEDATFGVREGLAVPFVEEKTGKSPAPFDVVPPFHVVEFDFKLKSNV
jgi:hydroxyquinol 1,2-dioxygenase